MTSFSSSTKLLKRLDNPEELLDNPADAPSKGWHLLYPKGLIYKPDCRVEFVSPQPRELTYEERKADQNWFLRSESKIAHLPCNPDFLARFNRNPYPAVISKPHRTKEGWTFAIMAEWINDQTKGQWSAVMAAPVDNRSKVSEGLMIFSFERDEQAVLFKMFQL